jgi:hypothetical protein
MKTLLILMIISFSTIGLENTIEIPPGEAKKHVGEKVKVCGKVVDTRFGETASRQTIISMGGGSPNQPLTIIISSDDRKNFSYKPEQFLKNKAICVNGKVVENNGKTELIVSRQDDIQIDEQEAELEIKANYFDFFNKYFDDKK